MVLRTWILKGLRISDPRSFQKFRSSVNQKNQILVTPESHILGRSRNSNPRAFKKLRSSFPLSDPRIGKSTTRMFTTHLKKWDYGIMQTVNPHTVFFGIVYSQLEGPQTNTVLKLRFQTLLEKTSSFVNIRGMTILHCWINFEFGAEPVDLDSLSLAFVINAKLEV